MRAFDAFMGLPRASCEILTTKGTKSHEGKAGENLRETWCSWWLWGFLPSVDGADRLSSAARLC